MVKSMIIDTIRFGKTKVRDESVLTFAEGLLGFEECKRFAIIVCEETEPIQWLQSVDDPAVSLPIINPFIIKPDYELDVDDAELRSIDTPAQADILVINVMVVPQDLKAATVNLCAPILINMKANKARQIVMEYGSGNAIRYPAFEALVAYYKAMEANAGKEQADAGTHAKD